MAERKLRVGAALVERVIEGARDELCRYAEEIIALQDEPHEPVSIALYRECRRGLAGVRGLLDDMGWQQALGKDIEIDLDQHREALLRALEWQQQLAAEHLRKSGAKQDAMVLQRLGVLMELASSTPVPGAERQRRDAAQVQA